MSETIADIVAEMREHNKETTPPYVCFTEEGGIDLSQIIDRIEAVTKCNQPETVTNCNGLGNAAKMREALEKMTDFINTWKDHLCGTIGEEAQEHINRSEAALSAPARNCDRFDNESEMRTAFIAYYNEAFDLKGSEYEIDTCDLKHDVDGILHEYINWLFAEAKESSTNKTNNRRKEKTKWIQR